MKTSTRMVALSAAVLLTLATLARPEKGGAHIDTAPAEVPPSPRHQKVEAPAARALLGAVAARPLPMESDEQRSEPGCDADSETVGGCVPVDPRTGAPYSAAEMARFDEIRTDCRERGLCGAHNAALPRVESREEAERRSAMRARTRELEERIKRRAASATEIDEYYAYVDQANHHKKQVLEYLYCEEAGLFDSGGSLSADVHLDPSVMSPELRRAYGELERVEAVLYLQRRIDARRQGIPIDGEDAESARTAQAFETARVRALAGGS